MAGRSMRESRDDDGRAVRKALGRPPRVLKIVAPYYEDVSDELERAADAVLSGAGCESVRLEVPGALEIPQALELALSSPDHPGFDGAVAIGCVIRGETSHYDIVVNNANHWLMDVALSHGVPVGNAILTVDTHEQAMVRARGGKGADAARAALGLIAIGAGIGLGEAGRDEVDV